MTAQPKRVPDLFRAITALSKESGTTERRLVALVGSVALSQMLPDSAIKGGAGDCEAPFRRRYRAPLDSRTFP